MESDFRERKREALRFFHALQESAERASFELAFFLGYCGGYDEASKHCRGIETRNKLR